MAPLFFESSDLATPPIKSRFIAEQLAYFFTSAGSKKLTVEVPNGVDTKKCSVTNQGLSAGGMLSVADDYIRNLNPEASLTLFGQELNGESYAIAKADMVIKGQDIENMVWGDTLTNDGHHGKYFDYCLANPPFGVEWKKQQAFVEREHRDRGFDGRLEKKTEIRESLAELQSPLGGADIRASNL